MSLNNKLDGTTSLGLPGIQGTKGIRSRVFFYGNAYVQDNIHRRIYFGTTQSDVDAKTKYAIIADAFEPEVYDYIMYTTSDYDYILLIVGVIKDGNDYKCLVKKIDELDLTKSSSDSEIANSVELQFNINKIKRSISVLHRNAKSDTYSIIKRNPEIVVITFPYTTTISTNTELIDISVAIPSNSSYVFDSNIKIVIEFYTNQSFIMDSVLFDKFDSNSYKRNTYRGDYEKYSILKKYNGDWVQDDLNFDDERLENFIFTIKDFDQFVGSKTFTASVPLMTSSLKRIKNNAEAYLYAYIKNGRFIDKFLIDQFDLSFINSPDDVISADDDYQWDEGGGSDSSKDPIIDDGDILIPIPPKIEWTCNCCGTSGNVGTTCMGCGKKQTQCLLPVDGSDTTWTCECCGHNGNTGNKCKYCGSVKGACDHQIEPSDPHSPIIDDPIKEEDPDFGTNDNSNNHLITYEKEII